MPDGLSIKTARDSSHDSLMKTHRNTKARFVFLLPAAIWFNIHDLSTGLFALYQRSQSGNKNECKS